MSNEDDRIRGVLASVPQNATAAKVMAKGEHWDPKVNYAKHLHSDLPLPVRAVPQGTEDLTGRRYGRFVVRGLGEAKGSNSQRAAWVVRCSCGHYEHRTGKAIRSAIDPDACCRNCEHLKIIQKRAKYRGSRPFSDFDPKAPNDGGRT